MISGISRSWISVKTHLYLRYRCTWRTAEYGADVRWIQSPPWISGNHEGHCWSRLYEQRVPGFLYQWLCFRYETLKKKKVLIEFFTFFNFKNSSSICIKSCSMVNAGTSSNFGKPGFGISTWPLTADNPLQAMKSKSSPGGTLDRVDLSVMSTKLHHSDGNLSYHVDDPPSLVAGKIIAYHHLKNVNIMVIYSGTI